MTVDPHTTWRDAALCTTIRPADVEALETKPRVGYAPPPGQTVEQWRVWLFYPVERTAPRVTGELHRDVVPKAICDACPVRAECRDWALATREPYGIWGGLDEEERRRIRVRDRRAS